MSKSVKQSMSETTTVPMHCSHQCSRELFKLDSVRIHMRAGLNTSHPGRTRADGIFKNAYCSQLRRRTSGDHSWSFPGSVKTRSDLIFRLKAPRSPRKTID